MDLFVATNVWVNDKFYFFWTIVSFPHEKREIVALDGCGITSAGEPGEIEAICPFVSELDITNNQIKEWNEVSLLYDLLPLIK